MTEIQRPGALYQQVAAALREAILSGEYEHGAPLPSEAQLIKRYSVSRPTVRNAVAALRAEGLIEVIHGKGSFVRLSPAPVLTIERRITRSGAGRYTTHTGTSWEQSEEPGVYRTRTTAETGQALHLGEEEALFGCDRLLLDPASGTRALHRTLIPFAVAEEVPELGQHPDSEPARIYELLAKAGHALWWSETVQARMPLPDERTALQTPDATPVLHLSRTTHGADDRPLLLEEMRLGADRAQAAYRITADKAPAARRSRA
ncbi:GntR family transcriptional regulator [Streptomyces sp. HNM0663]|uniref:GntR family transcriptional regulator n=1 Tax=Streptomyces chengmaiensis TaxID=3040919 RepID=A0ABT6HT76_9ACTN|nr:GntR family transcriptional regulator [Streptomyces chengmaiensis]MDH2391919.1 GntR family transcriptional regulator [Streptomyces chengmaiensis]